MSPAQRFFSGQNLEQAVLKAARHYGVEPERLNYSLVDKRHGFIRMRRRTLIEVDPERPTRPEPSARPRAEPAPRPRARPHSKPQSEPQSEPRPGPRSESGSKPGSAPPPRPPWAASSAPPPGDPATEERREATGELAEAALEGLDRLLALADLDLGGKVYQGPERLEVELGGSDIERVVADKGRALLAIEHLLPRLIRGISGQSTACRVDAGGFHGRRRRRLEELAREAAEQVSSSGRPRTLPPMAPDERRLVHRALRDVPGVTTESRGEGLLRRVAILPADEDR